MAIANNPASTVDQIMAINHSVKNTVNVISRLKTTMQAKLDLFQSVICE